MGVDDIIREIEKLTGADKGKLYLYVHSKLKKKQYLHAVLDQIKGSGKGVWDIDAQDYVNQLREDDRI